jgi:ABC-type glycerol-3-phosphate transport system substrate-binding protein
MKHHTLGIFCLLLSLLLVFVAGCGPAATTPEAEEPTVEQPTAVQPTAEQPTAVQPTAEQPTAVQPTAEQPIELQLWTWTTPTTHEYVTQRINTFKAEHPNVEVTYTEFPSVGEGAYEDKLLTSLATGSAADVFFITDSATQRYASSSQIIPIDDGVASTLGFGSMDELLYENLHYLPSALEGWSYEGKPYGFPYELSWLYLLANTDCMKDSGIDPESVDLSTWDNVIETASLMSRFDENGNFTREGFELPTYGDDTWTMIIATVFLSQSGGSVLSPDGSEAWINKPEAVAAFQQMVDIINSDAASPDFGAPGVGGVWTDFFSGESLCMSTWHPPAYVAGIKGQALEGRWKAYTMPHMKNGGPGNVYWGWAWVVNAATEHPSEAWQLAYTLGSDFELDCSTVGNWLPLDNLSESKCVQQNPEYKVIAAVPAESNPHFIFKSPHYPEIARIVRQYYELMIYEGMDVQEGLDAAATEINDILGE